MKVLVAGILGMASFALLLNSDVTSQEKPKYTIAQVMAKAMKGGLCAKVASGKATAEEKETLVQLFTALHANKAPKGDAASWDEKTKALLDAAKKGDGDALKKAANCAGCHKAHK